MKLGPTKYGRITNQVTAMMVEDMLFDPILGAKVLLGLSIPPHQELRLLWLWTTQFTCDDSGFSTGKSFNFAVVSALRSILLPGRVTGIISKTFAQGKLIFQNLDRWYTQSKIFRSCVAHHMGKPRLVHGNEVYQAKFRGGSEIRVLPPNWLQDAERIRSERWHDACLDEWTTYQNFKVLNSTIIGRVTNANHYPNCPVRQNHVHLASTPSFKHHPAYKMVENIQHQLDIGNKDYGRFTSNYRHIPNTKRWQWIVNRKVVYHMQTHNPKGIVKTEIDGLWDDDSGSYYSSKAIDEARNSVGLITRKAGPQEIYICGFDTARGGTSEGNMRGDDFSFSVMRMIVGEWKPHHVLTVRRFNITDVQMSGLIHKWNNHLGFNLIPFDPGGGGLFVKDKLKLSTQTIENEPVRCTPLIVQGDPSGVIGVPVLFPFSRGEHLMKQLWGKMQSDSVMINKAHREFRTAIENQQVALAPAWSKWENTGSEWNVNAKRKWLEENRHSLPPDDLLRAEMDLAVQQLIQVDVMRDGNNQPTLDSYGQYKFKSHVKKDAAYGLLYAFIGCLVFKQMMSIGMYIPTDQEEDDFALTMAPI